VRPTQEDLAYATDDLEELAHRHCPRDDPRNHTGFPDVITLLNLLVWVDTETKTAREAAAFGPGAEGGYRTLHHGGNVSDIDARTRDQLLKELRDLRSGWLVELGNVVDRWRGAAEKVVGANGLRAG
jgi:hypothetical protein